jgi:SAM-dependent methyltransferase
MHELSKSIVRRMSNPNFINHYFVGDGIDIGSGPDSLAQYGEQFPRMASLRAWDLDDGDAQFMKGVDDNTYDFAHSSHCLEHLHDPTIGLKNWLRIVKPGGHLIVMIPDEDLYEQGVFPSTFNGDHKWTFTLHKTKSWSNKTVNVLALLQSLGGEADIHIIQQLNSSFRFSLPRLDQTMTPVGECAIEFVIRKRTAEELAKGGRLPTAKPE